MVQIIPAILAKTEEEYSKKLKKIEESDTFREGWVHIDLMDGEFVEEKSIEPEIINKYPTGLKKEVHLMVQNPQGWIDKLKNVDRIIVHGEVGGNFKNIAINPDTPISILDNFQPEIVLIMGVHPGKQGQEFILEVLEKIKQLKAMGGNFKIGVDGGITPENAKLIEDAGADYLVVGSHLGEFNGGD